MQRITEKNLQNLCDTINREAGTPLAPWSRNEAGNLKGNIGCYHLDGAYGGWRFVQTTSEGGGIRGIIGGYLPKRELYDAMQGFLAGLQAGKGEI